MADTSIKDAEKGVSSLGFDLNTCKVLDDVTSKAGCSMFLLRLRGKLGRQSYTANILQGRLSKICRRAVARDCMQRTVDLIAGKTVWTASKFGPTPSTRDHSSCLSFSLYLRYNFLSH